MRPSVRLVAATTAAAATLVLSAGCGGGGVTIPTADGNVQLEKDGDTYKVETEDGSFVAGTELPDGFPESVPLIDGKILSGSALDSPEGTGFTVAVEVAGDGTAVSADIKAAFTEAGYKTVSDSSAGGSSILGFESEDWTVVVGVNPGDPATVSYTVAPASQ